MGLLAHSENRSAYSTQAGKQACCWVPLSADRHRIPTAMAYKNGIASVHPLRGPELRALRRLQRDYPHTAYVFVSERKAPLTVDAIRKIVNRAGREAGIEFQVHPHMLRHATGYKLANDGQDTRAIQQYLGHRNIQNTTRYTELAPDRFKDFWRD